jgi:hypothetical protein
MRQHTGLLVCGVAACGLGFAASAWAGGIEGHGRFEKIKGKPQMGYMELYESNLYLSPAGSAPVGPSRRLGTTYLSGTTCIIDTIGNGAYCIDGIPTGSYSVLVNQPLFFVAPKVVPNVTVPSLGMWSLNVDLGIDYSTFFKNDWTSVADSVWYQTFVATGTGIRGIAFSFAGNIPSWIQAAVLQDNGNPDVRTWPVVAERADFKVADVTDNWVRFRSADAPTVPGGRYAVRLTAVGANIQPYKRNKDGNSYSGGRAYDANGIAQNFDMNITVFSDNDGTSVTMNKRTEGGGDLVDGFFASKWGHTFVARGASLAAVDVWAAGASHMWDLDFNWRIFAAVDPTGPTGPQLGPTKTTKAAYQTFGMGLHGVSYSPNQIRLIPGQTYFIEFSVNNPPPESPGFNPYVMDDDFYEEGMGYLWTGTAWAPKPDVDLCMTVVEYKPMAPSPIVDPEVINKRVFYTGNATPETFVVANGGNSTLNYQIQESLGWLAVSPTQGSCTDEADTITINFSTAGLALGNHTGLITVSSPEAPNETRTITVNLQVDTVPPDFDRDTDVDVSDFGQLQNCLTAAGTPQTSPDCAMMKLDSDDDVDQADVELFLACVSGPDNLANPYCAAP